MMFSVVMPSYLGEYRGCATDREVKFMRAVQSLVEQTEQDWELWVIADGCQKTMDILTSHFYQEQRIKATMIDKQPAFHPAIRNVGIHSAEGEWIVYLDTDDAFGPNHLAILRTGIENSDISGWGCFNSIVYDMDMKEWREHECIMTKAAHCSTSNFIHRRDLGAWWNKGGYGDDFHFGQELRKRGPGTHLPTPQYFVLHTNQYDL